MSPTRRRLAAAAAALAVATALAGPSLGVSAATAQSGNADGGYQPCDPNDTRTVDLLLMMDQSRSLNRPEVDEGGEIRREALREIRKLLEGEWVLDDESPRGLRVALIGFDTSEHPHAPDFEPVAERAELHPSDEEIEAALVSRSGGAGHTDYGEALEAAVKAFEGSEADCRVMVWFTDGLHDPLPGTDAAEIVRARELRDRVCGTIHPAFEQAGIQTFAVLLGRRFVEPDQPEMADLSKAIIHAVTGHRDSPVVADLEPGLRCEGIEAQTGEILTAEKVEDLINTLIEAVIKTDHWQWPCDEGRSGSETSVVPLPSSTYIDSMEALAFGGEIEGYELLESGDSSWQPLKEGQRRLRLESDDLSGLSAGWALKMRVRPDDGGTPESVALRCYGKAVEGPLRMDASIFDADGRELDEAQADTTHTLSVDMQPFECPVDAGGFEIEPPVPPRRLPNQACEQGHYVEFAYNCGTPEAETRVTQFAGYITPRFLENLISRQAPPLEVQVQSNFVCLPKPPPPTTTTTTTTLPPPEPPTLDCDEQQRVDGEWEGEEFFGEVRVECTVRPPAGSTTGSGAVEVTTPSGGWDFRIEGAGGVDRRTIDSSDLPADLVVVDDLPRQGPWDRVGEVEVTLWWMQPEGAESETVGVGLGHDGWVDPLEFYPYWPTLQCADAERIRLAGDVPQQPLQAVTNCAAAGPGMGSVQIALEWTVAPDAPTVDRLESIDWRFRPLSESESGEGARSLRLTEGESLDPISFVTAGPLENERYEGDGVLRMTAVWQLPWGEQRQISSGDDVPVEIDLLRRSTWWVAALLVVAAALITYTMLYAIMARSARLPSAKQFYARRVEFQAQPDRAGNLTSAALDNISMDADSLVSVRGDHKTLRVEDLSIRAEYPRWSQFGLILDGGWGRPSLRSDRYTFGASPAHSRRGISSTPTQFTHLAVIALRTDAGAPTGTASGIAYLLVPKSVRDNQAAQFVAEEPNELLRKMTANYFGEVGRRSGGSEEETADPGSPQPPEPPPRAPSGPPPRVRTLDGSPPPRDRAQDETPPPRRPRQSPDRPEEPPPRRG